MRLLDLFLGLFSFGPKALEYPDGLKVEAYHVPKERLIKSKNGDTLTMHYTGTLTNGQKFDSSRDRPGADSGGKPFTFKLGAGQVIQGWEKGLTDMWIDEKRKLTIPPHMGYGERGFPPKIPPNSILIFDVELLDINGSKGAKNEL